MDTVQKKQERVKKMQRSWQNGGMERSTLMEMDQSREMLGGKS